MLCSSAVTAQEPRERTPREPQTRTPEAVTAPAGLCRLWITGVPASQQPAPTDCASAIRNRPSNAAVIYGAPVRSEAMEMEPFARRPGKLPIKQLAPGAGATRGGRDETAKPRIADSVAKPVIRKPEKPQ
jgi:hypothetical protein